jgi:hypothetical protein
MRFAAALAFSLLGTACLGTTDEMEGTTGALAASTGNDATTGATTSSGSTSAGSTEGSAQGTAATTGGASSGTTTGGTTGQSLPCCAPIDGSGASGTTGGANCTCAGDCQAACNPGTGTPLCLSFDNAPIEFTQAPGSFALTVEPSTTDWIGGSSPWLVLDRDGNGRIDDGRELFGSMTLLANGRTARDGFEALRALDSDSDGWLTPKDARFGELRLWSDRNQDRIAQPSELDTLGSRGIEALQLTNAVSPHCDSRGNCELERAVFYFRDGQAWHRGALIDVHMQVRSTDLHTW